MEYDDDDNDDEIAYFSVHWKTSLVYRIKPETKTDEQSGSVLL